MVWSGLGQLNNDLSQGHYFRTSAEEVMHLYDVNSVLNGGKDGTIAIL